MKGKKTKQSKWKDEFYVLAYQMAKDGHTDAMIAKRMGVDPSCLHEWLKTNVALAKCLEDGRRSPGEKHKNGYLTFKDYVHDKLPKQARDLWDKLEEIDSDTKDPDWQVERDRHIDLISAKSTVIRQHLYLHALIHSNFMHSVACRKVGMAYSMVDDWCKNTPGFRLLLDGINNHKKDFFESALINLVRQGDSAAIIFANRTLNRDRGYDSKVTVEIDQKVHHTHSITADDLPVESQRAILEAIRRKRLALEDRSNVEEAEVVDE